MLARDRMQPSLIEKLFDEAPKHYEEEHHRLFRDFKVALNRGEIRAAEQDPGAKSGWRVNAWVKKGVLVGFRIGVVVDMSIHSTRQPFFDKSTYPARAFAASGHAPHNGCVVSLSVIGAECEERLAIRAKSH